MSRERSQRFASIREAEDALKHMGYRYHRMSFRQPGTLLYRRPDGARAKITENADSGVVFAFW